MVIEKRLLSVREAATVSGMSSSWWRRKIFLREVAFVKVGGSVRIPVPVIEALIAGVNRTVAPIQ